MTIFAPSMEQVQFTALALLLLLTVKLLILPKQASSIPIVSTSRWLMASGTVLLAIQFLLQYKLGLRSIGVTQAVMVNLIFFIPSSTLFSLAVLYLQKQGHLNKIDKYIGLVAWIISLILIAIGIIVSGQPILAGARSVFKAEILASIIYIVAQGYYTARHLQQLHRIRYALANYYDRDMDYLLTWMRISIFIMAPTAVLVPFSIYFHNRVLQFICAFIFVGIFYLVDSFCLYASVSIQKMMEAEQSEDETVGEDATDKEPATAEKKGKAQQGKTTISNEVAHRIELAVAQWTAEGKHLRSGINCPDAADEMHLPRYQFSLWLKQNGTNYREWLNDLRIKEAKQVLTAHLEWGNEAIAQHCGFSDRSYFQKVFKEKTGMTPAQYVEKEKGEA